MRRGSIECLIIIADRKDNKMCYLILRQLLFHKKLVRKTNSIRNRYMISQITTPLALIICILVLPLDLVYASATNSVIEQIQNKANSGNTDAMFILGREYYEGKILPKDVIEAIRWWKKAAEAGDSNSMYNLGICSSLGTGVNTSDTNAFIWWLKAAEAGQAKAMYKVGFAYGTGQGVEKNIPESTGWFLKASEAGDVESMYALGLNYYSIDVSHINYSEAVKWYSRAAELGHMQAMFNLAHCYVDGIGVLKNQAEAFKWYYKAALKGSPRAMTNLGVCYSRGEGVIANSAEAIKWYRKAAAAGETESMFSIGKAYFEGEGLKTDDILAYAWITLAVVRGNADCKTSLKQVESFMSPSQVAIAKTLVSQWLNNKIPIGEREVPLNPSPCEKTLYGIASGFFITSDGFLITAAHTIKNANSIEVLTPSQRYIATIIRKDETGDVALLKVKGNTSSLPISSSRGITQEADIFTVGYTNKPTEWVAGTLMTGKIESLNGHFDDPTSFRINMPVCEGTSGGPILDYNGCVIGVITKGVHDPSMAKLYKRNSELFNYATKSSYVLPLLDAIPVTSILAQPPTRTSFDSARAIAEKAVCIVLVYR
jgi:hypothetical protein